MVQLHIIRDNREQKPWGFEDHDATISDETINTGDYTLKEFCDHDEDKDTYYPHYAVERKSGQDFIQSITRGRDRFQAEIKRASDWESDLLVLIEEPKKTFKRKRGFMRHRNVAWSQISGTVETWERYYNVDFRFVGTRKRAQQKAFDALSSRLRAKLTSE